jgi:acetate kinase
VDSNAASILTLNAGSSTVKFAVFAVGDAVERSLTGQIDRVDTPAAMLTWQTPGRAGEGRLELPPETPAAGFLLDWLATRSEAATLAAVGHRVVHGLARTEPARITGDVLEDLRRAEPYAPDHLPREIRLIEAVAERRRGLPQVACFDTAFHHDMPVVARLLPLPRRYQAMGLQRYGFHGLSYAYLLEELARVGGRDAAHGRVILAHLGNGASLAAVHRGCPVDTSMGFTPASGLVMSTRSGDLDPGVVAYLAETEGLTPRQFHAMVNHEAGLLGVSETSGDMRDLLDREADDGRAADAVAMFCYQAKKWVGAFAAALGGLDTLVYSAGVGAGSATIRARIATGLSFLGLELDPARNAAHAPVISTPASRVTVRVMPTDEELMIARLVIRTLDLGPSTKDSDA